MILPPQKKNILENKIILTKFTMWSFFFLIPCKEVTTEVVDKFEPKARVNKLLQIDCENCVLEYMVLTCFTPYSNLIFIFHITPLL